MMMMMVKPLMVMDGVGCVDNTLFCFVRWLWTVENDNDGDGGYEGGVQCPRKRKKIKLLQKRSSRPAFDVLLCHDQPIMSHDVGQEV